MTKTTSKKWLQYLLEFTMVFLGVYLSFLAENFRESRNNDKIEKKYLASMIDDLSRDTMQLSKNVQDYDRRLTMQDSLLKRLANSEIFFSRALWEDFQSIRGYQDFIYSDATLQQLKAGALPIVKNNKIVKAMLEYDALVKHGLINERILYSAQLKLKELGAEIINWKKIHESNIDVKVGARIDDLMFRFFIANDKDIFLRYYNEIYSYRGINKLVRNDMLEIKNAAENLIKIIQNEMAPE